MKKRILSILLTLCMVLCLMPTAVFAEGNEDTPTQALTSVDITFPKPEEGKKIGDGSAASASDLTFLDFGPSLWQQGSKPKKLKAEDTYQKDSIYLLYFAFYTQKPITDETALTFNGNPITRYADYQALTEALNAYDGQEEAYLGFVTFSKDGTGDPSMEDLKNIYVVGLYAIIRAQEHTVEEQFNLDSGGTYYFDLSGESIPGTVNDSLPDKTMHYVPFTYAGTVDAYKLTSETATTEEYAQKNKYDHSLFVADYAVTKDVSRDALNTANLIFGKNYASGGVDYTLRAPSVGSNATGSNESLRGTPQSNEWDRILDKDEGYIKNWSKMYSWGQDTSSVMSSRCAVRGYHESARYGSHNSSWYNSVGLGFRPVLEVLNPDALGSNGLKVVTLNLGGGKLGNSSEDIQIIVKNDSEFTAPASHGLTRPDGNNGSYFMWLGSDGNLYAPGESVSADVTKLTALFYEQFNLAPGGTYYFDLFGENIPGKVNGSLPDSTLHYVPFTYVGTVNAYKLTSETATTEEYAEQNKYDHSLFVADYNVTHNINWDDLNTANLIFGKDYAAGGVDYTLRAPSVGSGNIGSNESQRGTPQSNEWDKMLDKDDEYIKNWGEMFSWGQDTWSTSASCRVNRGHNSVRNWDCSVATFQYAFVGFRPVLEVLSPDTLGADGLKAVTLDLGGGKLGDISENIKIIVKTDSNFTAPASDGLTRPDGNNGSYFKWLGSDGNLYAPGESVPANVTKLTAKFAGGSSGSGGGGGSRKPSVTYYTLHFETDGGSAITDVWEAYNTRISLIKYVPTRQGHTFIGWYSDRSLTNQVSEVSLTKNMTVYAGWRADENPDIVVNPFTDVSEKDWFYNDAMFVYKNGLMLGTSKTLFSPHGTVTRGMMATILWRMEGSLAPKGENSFTDVEAGRWYADAITWTTENGIFAGYSKDKFGPDDPITREQLTAIFYRYADYKGYKLTVTENLDKFEDADKITDYAKTVMQWAVGNGLIKGKSENLLDPQGTATRAEISAMLHRFIEKANPMQTD